MPAPSIPLFPETGIAGYHFVKKMVTEAREGDIILYCDGHPCLWTITETGEFVRDVAEDLNLENERKAN